MPSDGDGANAEDRRDGNYRLPLEFMHHDDSAPAWVQAIECPPHGRSDQKRPFRVVLPDRHVTQFERVAPAHRLTAPLISSNVHEYTDQPGFLTPQSTRNEFA